MLYILDKLGTKYKIVNSKTLEAHTYYEEEIFEMCKKGIKIGRLKTMILDSDGKLKTHEYDYEKYTGFQSMNNLFDTSRRDPRKIPLYVEYSIVDMSTTLDDIVIVSSETEGYIVWHDGCSYIFDSMDTLGIYREDGSIMISEMHIFADLYDSTCTDVLNRSNCSDSIYRDNITRSEFMRTCIFR